MTAGAYPKTTSGQSFTFYVGDHEIAAHVVDMQADNPGPVRLRLKDYGGYPLSVWETVGTLTRVNRGWDHGYDHPKWLVDAIVFVEDLSARDDA